MTTATLAQTIDLAAAERRARALACRTVRDRLRLPPKLRMSEWAERHRVLSAESSASPGEWRNEVVPYGVEIMDTISGRECEEVTIVAPSQSAKTELGINNPVGYYIDQEPSPILVIQPSQKPMAEAWSKERLAPMLRDCPRLRGKVKDPRSRDSGNTVLMKTFSGGILAVMGANSPAGLASRPIRIVLADELDRWPASAGTEGDPLSLARARTLTFRHRKKVVKVSSPGNEGESRIEKEWEHSDQRHFYVPCPHCAERPEWDGAGAPPSGWQVLEWRDSQGNPGIRPGKGPYLFTWEKEIAPDGSTVHHPETAFVICKACGSKIEETAKPWMSARGRWVKHNPASRKAGFHIPFLLLTWVRWADLAAKWLEVKDDPEQRKTYINTALGLLYVADGERADADALESRRESFGAEVPAAVGFITMSTDVQADRLECAVWGWCEKEEVYLLHFERIDGQPEEDAAWERWTALLNRPFHRASGAPMHVDVAVIDSQFLSEKVYKVVKPLEGRSVYAVRGEDKLRAPMNRGSRNNKERVKVFSFNPTQYKDVLFPRLKRSVPGAGFIHIGSAEETGVDKAFLEQFSAERREVDYRGTSPVVRYVRIGKRRNEAIDLYNMGRVALHIRGQNFAKFTIPILVQGLKKADEERRAQQRVAAAQPAAASPALPQYGIAGRGGSRSRGWQSGRPRF